MRVVRGNVTQELRVDCNTPDAVLFANAAANSAKGLPEVAFAAPRAVICGGGPSLADTLGEVRMLVDKGAKLFALNYSARFMVEHGFHVDGQIVLDARPDNVHFIEKPWADRCYVASQADPVMIEKCAMPVTLWHPCIDGIDEAIGRPVLKIGGGTTVGLSGLCLVYALGFCEIHCFGYDSSDKAGASHAYRQDLNKNDEKLRACVNDRVFSASIAMAAQASKFVEVAKELANLGCEIHVHGDGLLPHLFRTTIEDEQRKVLTAVYDLASSPPTFDILSFLAEAERKRKAGGYDCLDVVFQPGPMRGFRDDELPPSTEQREWMLHRICVPACRLVPSVRNVTVLKQRAPIDGDVFPEWTLDNVASHYGTQFWKGDKPGFRASDAARAYVAKRFRHYVTITMRETDYWPARNSVKPEWTKVEAWLKARGFDVVVVPDTAVGGSEFAVDLDLRMALYEGAVVNLGVSNGPMALCYLTDAPYIVFKILADGCASTTRDFLAAHGYEFGDQFSDNGRIVWDDDRADIMIPVIQQWLESRRLLGEKNAIGF